MTFDSQPRYAGQDRASEPAQAANGNFSAQWPALRDAADGGRPPSMSPAASHRLSRSGDSDRPPSDMTLPTREIETEDWDSLFGAVEDKLRESVAGVSASGYPPLNGAGGPRNLKAIVLDCVASLEYLHASLKRGRK